MLFPVLICFGKLGNIGPQVEGVELSSKISSGTLDLVTAVVGFALDVLEALFSLFSLNFC